MENRQERLQHLYRLAGEFVEEHDLPSYLRPLIASQWALESNFMESKLAVEDTNYGGLTKVGGGWASYQSEQEFKDDAWNTFWRHYDVSTIKPGDIKSFTDAMSENKYIAHEGDYEKYMNNLPGIMNELSRLDPDAGIMVTPSVGSQAWVDPKYMKGRYTPDATMPVDVDSFDTREAGFISKTEDTFFNTFNTNGVVAVVRSGMTYWGTEKDENFSVLSDSTQKELETAFPNNPYIQASIRSRAMNEEHLRKLIELHKEDEERAQRCAKREFGMHSVVGGLLGLAMDPVNWIPVIGEVAMGGKIASTLTMGVASRINPAIYRAVMESAGQGLINVLDQKVAEKYGMGEADEATAFALGVAGTMGFRALAHMNLSAKAKAKALDVIHSAQERAVIDSAGLAKTPHGVKLGQVLMDYNKSYDDILVEAVENPKGWVAEALEIDFKKAKGAKTTPKDFQKWLHDSAGLLGYEIKNSKGKTFDVPREVALDIKDLLGAKRERLMKMTKKKNGVRTLETSKYFKLQDLLRKIDPSLDVKDFMKLATRDGKSYERFLGEISPVLKSKRGLRHVEGYKLKGHAHAPGEIRIPRKLLDKLGVSPRKFEQNPLEYLKKHPELADEVMPQARNKKLASNGISEPYWGADFENAYTLQGKQSVPLEPIYREVGGAPSMEEVMTPTSVPPEVAPVVGSDPMSSEFVKNGFTAKAIRKVTKFLETNTITGTKYGLFVNSESKTLRSLAPVLFYDPVRRGHNGGISVIEDQVNALGQRTSRIIRRYENSYTKWAVENRLNPTANANKRKFNKLVSDICEGVETGNSSKAISEAVQAVKEFRELNLKRSKSAGLIDTMEFDDPHKLYRRVDKVKTATFISQFENIEDFRKVMRKYFDAKVERDKLPDDVDLSELRDEWVEHLIDSVHPTKSVTTDTALKHWKKRVPMDTSSPFVSSTGLEFSFDGNLREYDMSRIMQDVAHRTHTAIAFKQNGISKYGEWGMDNYKRIEVELNDAVMRGKTSRKHANKTLETYREAWRQLTRTNLIDGEDINDRGVFQRFRDIVRTGAYARVGANMYIWQSMEGLSAIATTGGAEAFRTVPGLKKWVDTLCTPREFTDEQLKEFKDVLIGMEIAQDTVLSPRIDSNEILSRNGSKIAKYMGIAEDTVAIGAKVTSTLNQMHNLTNWQIANIKTAEFSNLMQWARGTYSSNIAKNAFNEDKFAIAGITDIEGFRKTLLERLGDLPDEKGAILKAMDKWEAEDLVGATKLHAFLDVNSRIGMLQPTIGGSNLHSRDSVVLPILHQFKEFSRMAIHGHGLRALHNPEMEDFHRFWLGAVGGAFGVSLKSYIYAQYRYRDDPKGKEKYLKENFTGERLLRASIVQNAFLSWASYANDGYETMTGAATVRFTAGSNEPRPVNSAGDFIGNIAQQTPAVGFIDDNMHAFRGIVDYLRHEELSGKEERAVRNIIPLDKIVLWQALAGTLGGE